MGPVAGGVGAPTLVEIAIGGASDVYYALNSANREDAELASMNGDGRPSPDSARFFEIATHRPIA